MQFCRSAASFLRRLNASPKVNVTDGTLPPAFAYVAGVSPDPSRAPRPRGRGDRISSAGTGNEPFAVERARGDPPAAPVGGRPSPRAAERRHRQGGAPPVR